MAKNISKNVLLSKRFFSWISRGIKLGEYFGAHPFSYSLKRNQFKGFSSTRQVALWKLNFGICFVNFCFVFIRCLQVRSSTESSDFQKVYITLWVLMYIVPLCNHFQFLLRPEIPEFVNLYVEFQEDLYRFQGGSAVKKVKGPFIMRLSEYALVGNIFGLKVLWFLTVALSIVLPNSPEFLSSLVSIESSWLSLGIQGTLVFVCKVAVRLFSVFVTVVVMYNFMATLTVLMAASFPCLFGGPVILTELGSLKPAMYNLLTSNWDRLKVYKELQILVKQATYVFEICISYAKALLMFIIIYSFYGAIKFSGFLALAMGYMVILATVMIIIIFIPLGLFFNQSKKLLMQWERQSLASHSGRDKLYCFELRSVHPLKFYIARMYFCDKAMLLTIFSFILESIVDLLMLG